MRRLVLVAAAVLFSTGCGGIISSVFIVQGTVALAGARAANAENLATYEYVSAEAYLKKAREAHSYSDFEHSLRFARLAAERANVARKKALEANKPLDPNAPPPEGQPGPDGTAPPPAGTPPPAAQPQPAPVAPQPGQPAPGAQAPQNRPQVIIQKVPEPAPAPQQAPPPAGRP